MATYMYRYRGNLVSMYDETELMRHVKSGVMSGKELIRLDGDPDAPWIPMYSLPWFRSAVGADDTVDLQALANRRAVRGPLKIVGWIFGTYFGFAATAGLMAGLTQQGHGGMAAVVGVTAAGLAGFGIRKLWRGRKAADKTVLQASAGDPLDTALSSLMVELEQCSPELRTATNVDAIRKSIGRLRSNRTWLTAANAGVSREELIAELGSARAKMSAATSDSLREACLDEIRALEERITTLDATASMATENETRISTLLHEIEGLRLALGRSRIDLSDENALVDRLAELRASLDRQADTEAALEQETRRGARMSRTIGILPSITRA